MLAPGLFELFIMKNWVIEHEHTFINSRNEDDWFVFEHKLVTLSMIQRCAIEFREYMTN